MMNNDQILWGKLEPRVTLSRHMIAVGACIKVYLTAPSSAGLLRRIAKWMGVSVVCVVSWLAYVFSLHDIGKAHPELQYRDDATRILWYAAGHAEDGLHGNTRFRHEVYSEYILKRIWKNTGIGIPAREQATFLAAVRLHHQGKRKSDFMKYLPDGWTDVQDDLERRMRALFLTDATPPSPDNADAQGILLTALLVLSDWVASSDGFGVYDGEDDIDDAAYLAWAEDRARRTLEQYGLVSDRACAYPQCPDFCEMWPFIPESGMRPLQRAAQNLRAAPLTIIEAPMGEGKTETALYLAGLLCRALGLHGIYMALPTAATSNQMVSRVRALLGQHGLGDARLLHGTAWMLDAVSPLPDTAGSDEDDRELRQSFAAWLRPLRRGMLSENAVGTVDQAMAAVLRIKYGMLRLAGLANKVLIIDEIHAYDVYMRSIITRLLAWCRQLEIPVILLSATLQKKQKKEYLACYGVSPTFEPGDTYPLITQVDECGHAFETPVSGTAPHPTYHFDACASLGDARAVARLAQRRAEHGGCVCVMLNTVKSAQAVCAALRETGDTQIMLFHARYKWKHRARIERQCLERFGKGGARPKRMILVCTQVVEQSLDLDFDAMITEIAPVDLLLQRAGRVQRHENVRPVGLEEALITVLTPLPEADADAEKRYGACGAVYAPCVLWSTEKWLGQRRDISVEDIRASVDMVYADFDEAAMESYLKKQIRDQSDRAMADGAMYPQPDPNRFFGATRSAGDCFSMEEPEEMDDRSLFHTASGARTRLGRETVRIAFLPRDFDDSGNERDVAMLYFDESCSMPWTPEILCAIMVAGDEILPKVAIDKTGLIILREEAGEAGYYRLGNIVFHADDAMGIWWEVSEL